MLIEIVPDIDLIKVADYLQSPDSGGIVTFTGTVRSRANGKEVTSLHFEAYEPMAIAEMEKIAVRAQGKWPLNRLAMQHVVGTKSVGAMVVVVGASSAHRAAAFEACQFMIDALKATVPIWKKEFYTDSSIWVAAHP